MDPVQDQASWLFLESTSVARWIAVAASTINLLINMPLLLSIIWYETRVTSHRYEGELFDVAVLVQLLEWTIPWGHQWSTKHLHINVYVHVKMVKTLAYMLRGRKGPIFYLFLELLHIAFICFYQRPAHKVGIFLPCWLNPITGFKTWHGYGVHSTSRRFYPPWAEMPSSSINLRHSSKL